jgi:hypothetical protein
MNKKLVTCVLIRWIAMRRLSDGLTGCPLNNKKNDTVHVCKKNSNLALLPKGVNTMFMV